MHVKKDKNHNAIEDIFKRMGFATIDTSICHGILLDFIAYNSDSFYFVEVKNGKKPLTINELKFIEKHANNSVVIHSVDEALTVLSHLIAKF